MGDEDDLRFMGEALAEARLAGEQGEVPVGSVIVVEGRIVARGRNLRETLQDPTAHAELLAVQRASQALGTWRLGGATCFVTLEPCAMCAGALVHARVDRVVYAALDPKAGATHSLFTIGQDPRLNHRFGLVSGVRADEASLLLKRFFAELRRAQKVGKTLTSIERGALFRASLAAAEPKGPDEDATGEDEDEHG